MTKHITVVGMQWGDEGKGKIVDWLCNKADVALRFQGGNNAGHTIVIDDTAYKLNLLPSSILRNDKLSIIGNGVALDASALMMEIENLKSVNIDVGPHNLLISENCPLILNLHKQKEELFENLREQQRIDTTNKGIGPCYEDKVGRRAIRLCDLQDHNTLREKVSILLQYHNTLRKGAGLQPLAQEEVINELENISQKILPYLQATWQILDKLKPDKRIIFEGAQGILLDIDHGTYPFVTSSNTIAPYAAVGSGIYCKDLHVLGVMKAYITRVGNGPFPTEQKNETGKLLFNIGKEVGTVSGRERRCGWFDAVLAKQAISLAKISSIALTKLDILDSFDVVKICTGYKFDNKIYDYLPALSSVQQRLEPVYEELPGWKKKTSDQSTLTGLPTNARKYIERIEELLEKRISLISTSPKRDNMIVTDSHFIN
ncbi:adenylosuccinate synthase [Candidatus Mesenet endosymbiont of Agriotes lineatus]|uniref:adenylosuccinate synthase n=1 Tax=Candidatus Mesenet endosymbiont of Agriotes lineatus TaxID=3077948 RepID=UPI0030CC66F7